MISIFLSSFFFLCLPRLSQRSEIGCLPYFHTRCGLSANLECMSEMRCTLLAEIQQKLPFWYHRTNLSGCIFAAEACIDNRKKNFLSSDMSCTCLLNMVNFGVLTAEIVSLVWGTPANFNGFRVLAALLNGI